MNSDAPFGNSIRLLGDNRASVTGFNFETRNITVVAMNENAIVLKIGARTCWSGNFCPREYHPPDMLVYRIVKTSDDGKILHVEPMIEWSLARKPKANL